MGQTRSRWMNEQPKAEASVEARSIPATGTGTSWRPDSPEHIARLDIVEKLMKRGASKDQITNAVLEHMQYFSIPITPMMFGRFAPAVPPILKRLNQLGIEVFRTPENFIWANGKYAQSQLGKCITSEGRGYVFLDVVGQNTDDIELLDTMLHESVHSTGPILGRWKSEDQPTPKFRTHRMDQNYLVEESIAMLGSAKIMVCLFARSLDPSGEWRKTSTQVLDIARKAVCDLLKGNGPFPEIEAESTQAAKLLTQPWNDRELLVEINRLKESAAIKIAKMELAKARIPKGFFARLFCR